MILTFIKERATLFVFIAGVVATVAFGGWSYSKGKQVERSVWLQKQSDELKEKNDQLISQRAEILKLQSERDTTNRLLTEATQKRSEQLQQELQTNDQETEATIAKLLADNRELRNDLRLSEANAATSGLAATTLGHYAAGKARLSDEAVRFLGREAGRCNAVVHTLTACQGTLSDWRKAVNDYNASYFGSETKK